jgi:hypothetical protein
MVDWDPKDHMGWFDYNLLFKSGYWVEVNSRPEWVRNASNPPDKTKISPNGSVDAVFTGNSLQYKVITKRKSRGAGTYLEQEYKVRIKPENR